MAAFHCAAHNIKGAWMSASWLQSVWMPAVTVLLLYGAWLVSAAHTGYRPTDFTWAGTNHIDRSSASVIIRSRQPVLVGSGYDGQFYYYLALDPLHARYYMDSPSYRYTRIVYPLTARLLALGNPNLIPYTLILVNLLALCLGTLVVAAWLRRKGYSPWAALLLGLSPGLFVVLQRDLAEALALALVASAVYLFDFGGRYRLPMSAPLFAFAALTRETTVLFPLIYGVTLFLENGRVSRSTGELLANAARVTLFLGAVTLPLLTYKYFLYVWIGHSGVLRHLYPTALPFGGILRQWPWGLPQVEELVAIITPALIWLWMGSQALLRRLATPAICCLIAYITVFVIFLNHDSYGNIMASGRIAAGAALAALFCWPVFNRLGNGVPRWFWIAALFWLSPFPSLWMYEHHRPIAIDAVLPCAAGLVFLMTQQATRGRTRGSEVATTSGGALSVTADEGLTPSCNSNETLGAAS